jgi:ATP-binding cassette subfamily B protein
VTAAPPAGWLRAALALQWRAAPIASCVAAALTVLTGSLAAGGAWLTKRLLDELARGAAADRELATLLVIGAAASAGVVMAVLHLHHFLDRRIQRAITGAAEHALFVHVGRLGSLATFEDPAFHDRLRLAEQASQEAPQHVAGVVQLAIQTAVTLSTLTGVVVAVSPVVAILFVICAIATVAAQLARSRSQAVAMASLSETHRRRAWYRALLVDVRAAKEIRLYGLADLLLARMQRARTTAARTDAAVDRVTCAWQIGLALVCAAATAAGAVIVARGALDGRFQLGDVALFLAAIAAIQGVLSQLVLALGHAGAMLRMFGSYLEILAMPTPADGGAAPGPLRDAIELRDVWFRYGPDQPWVLRGVTLRIAAGESLGLVGSNGAGKSTLVKLLCGLYTPVRGAICWDGVALSAFDPRALRRRIAATFQDFMTYDLSAAENIAIGDVARIAELAPVRTAAARVGIDDTLAALPHGYHTVLSRVLGPEDGAAQTGVSLSGGQWQRVAIARALMRRDADLVILDEPSAGLDAEAEHQLHRALAGAGHAARLSISHRLGGLRAADRIAVLHGGEIAELGNHDQLMQRGGHYARLFRLQARDYQDARIPALEDVA